MMRYQVIDILIKLCSSIANVYCAYFDCVHQSYTFTSIWRLIANFDHTNRFAPVLRFHLLYTLITYLSSIMHASIQPWVHSNWLSSIQSCRVHSRWSCTTSTTSQCWLPHCLTSHSFKKFSQPADKGHHTIQLDLPPNSVPPKRASELVKRPICYVCTYFFEIISKQWVQKSHNGTMNFRLMAFC